MAVASTIANKFSFSEKVLDDLGVLMPENQDSITVDSVLRLAAHFPAAVPEESFDTLEEEALDYILTPSSTMPSVRKEEGKPTQSVDMCVYWQEIGRMKTLEGRPRFPNLTKLAKCLLALPHSNADTERVFSMVRKIVTDYRTEMEQSTLCALVACKLNSDCDCFKLETPKELLKKAKGATTAYNKEHSSKQ